MTYFREYIQFIYFKKKNQNSFSFRQKQKTSKSKTFFLNYQKLPNSFFVYITKFNGSSFTKNNILWKKLEEFIFGNSNHLDREESSYLI